MKPTLPTLAAVLLVSGLLAACTTVDSLKPGVARGTIESGFMKTTEGLSLTVRDRSYDEVWAPPRRPSIGQAQSRGRSTRVRSESSTRTRHTA